MSNVESNSEAPVLSQEQVRAILSEFDFQIVVDISGSMNTADIPNSRLTRYKYLQESATVFAHSLDQIDSNGLDLTFFSGRGVESHEGVNASKLSELFNANRPGDTTPLDKALTKAFQIAGKSDKKDFIVVFTDGAPDDQAAAAEVIRKQANSQVNDDDLTVLFIQVGYDAGATEYLRNLDDNLKGVKHDIVDVKTVQEAEKFDSVEALLVAAING